MPPVPIIIGAIILIFGVGYLVTSPSTTVPEATTQPPQTDVVRVSDATSPVDTSAMTEQHSPELGEISDAKPIVAGVYTEYTADAIAQSNADHILLFFKASWCPSCRALDADIVANADAIPSGVEIYTVDYDTATALKQQYGITMQHSIIEIDSTGQAKSSISHGLTLRDVLATI